MGAVGVEKILVLVFHAGFGGFHGNAVPLQDALQADGPRRHHADQHVAQGVAAAFKKSGGIQHAGARAAHARSLLHAFFALGKDRRVADLAQAAETGGAAEHDGGQRTAVQRARGGKDRRGKGGGQRRFAGVAFHHLVGDGVGVQDLDAAPLPHQGGDGGFSAAGGAGQADLEHGVFSFVTA